MRLLVNIDVPDLAAAERFYTQAFDLRYARRFGADAVELSGANVPVYLLCKPSLGKSSGPAASASAQRDYARHWSPVHCDVVVDDIDVALVAALAAGAHQEGAIRYEAWGRIVQLADPFGHGWCLLQFVGRGYDETASS
ncbi:MAG: VOC family protein [Luteimonas sp.]